MVIDSRKKIPKCFYCGNKLEIQNIYESGNINEGLLPGTITIYNCKCCQSVYSVYLPIDILSIQ